MNLEESAVVLPGTVQDIQQEGVRVSVVLESDIEPFLVK